MSNLWQPLTDARRRRVTKVFDEQADSFDMTSLSGTSVAPPFLWELASFLAAVTSVCASC
jgi:hypothetical protein